MISFITFQAYENENSVNSISINGDTIASGGGDEKCDVRSIPQKQLLYSTSHILPVECVQLLPDSSLGFNLITSSDDRTVKLWRNGELVESLKHSSWCERFDLDRTNRLLTVATEHGVTVWRIDNFSKIGEQKIGWTMDVRFNAASTKVIAVKESGKVYEIALKKFK